MARRVKKKKALPYKGLIRSAKAIMKDKNMRSDKAEQFLNDVDPFLTKKGELRKNISQSKLDQFNSIVANYRKGFVPSKKKIKKAMDKQLATAIQNETYNTEKEQKIYQDIFGNDAVKDLMKSKDFESGQIETIIKTFSDKSVDMMINAFKVIKALKDMELPDEVKDFFPMDDAGRRLTYFLQLDRAQQEQLLEWIFEDEGIEEKKEES